MLTNEKYNLFIFHTVNFQIQLYTEERLMKIWNDVLKTGNMNIVLHSRISTLNVINYFFKFFFITNTNKTQNFENRVFSSQIFVYSDGPNMFFLKL